MSKKFEVVISGVSGRFPECDDINTFKKKLYDSENFITDNDKKWKSGYKCKFDFPVIPNATGKYTNIQPYDYRVFKFHTEYARVHDIISRKMLEPSFEAIVDAGVNPYSLDGDNVGVFMASGINELEAKMSLNDAINQKILTGVARTMQSNRVSFAFNFTGPSCTYQADVLGSLRALCAAHDAIADGTVNAAIVGVASNIRDPEISQMFLNLNFLSQDGLCRCFDKNASGYGRSESAVVLFLQRAEEAKRNYGTILFCEDYYFGINPSTILKNNEDSMKKTLLTIYEKYNFVKMAPQLAFMELSGCGIKKCESVELNSIADVACKNRNSPLLVGSIKSNIGHTEAAAALMSLLKVLFALDTEIIAPNINLDELNDEIPPLKCKKLQVVTEKTNLPGDIAGVNAIGMYGVVGHAVLKQNSNAPKADTCDKPPRLLLICGRTEESLQNAIQNIQEVPYNQEFIALTNDVFSSYIPAFGYRGYTILPKQTQSQKTVQERGGRNRPVWFVFSGMGSQWNEMGKGLLDIPIFSEAIEKCSTILNQKGINLYHLLTSDDPTLFDKIVNSFVAITSMQLALLEILKAIDIKPDGIIGHSAGEIGCAYADGCLTFEQSLLSAYERGMAFDTSKTIKGMMAAVGLGNNEMKDLLPEGIEVACHNSATSCTLSGPAEKIIDFMKELTNKGIFTRNVNVANMAAHSSYIATIGPVLCSKLKQVIPNPKERSPKWISTSVPECEWETSLAKYCSAEYMKNNLLNPVLFEEGCQHIPPDAIVIEIAPHGILQAILKKSLPPSCTNVSLTYRSTTKENLKFLLSALGKLYIAGCEPKINNLFPKIPYPVPRGTPSIAPYCTWYHEEPDNKEITYLRLIRNKVGSTVKINVRVNEDAEYNYLQFHRIAGQMIIPPSFIMYLSWIALSHERNEPLGISSILFENVRMHKHNVSVSVKKHKYISVMVQASGYFEAYIENKKNKDKNIVVIMSGRIEVPYENVKIDMNKESWKHNHFAISKEQFYFAYENVGYHLTNSFSCVKEVFFQAVDNYIGGVDYYGKITWNENWVTFLDSLMKFHMYSNIHTDTDLLYPYFIRKLYINCSQFAEVKTGASILCHKDLTTQNVRCDGLEMCGVDYKIFPLKSLTNTNSHCLKVQGLQFVSYDNPRCKSAWEFLNLCLHITVENFTTRTKSHSVRVCIMENVADCSTIMTRIIKENQYLRSNVKFVSEKDIRTKTVSQETPLFLLTGNLKQTYEHFDTDKLFLLTVNPLSDVDSINKSFIVITKQSFSGKVFCLLKKKSNQNGYVNPELRDHESLTSVYERRGNEEAPDFIVRHQIESADLCLMLSRHKRDYDKRYIFLIDENSETSFNKEKSLIKSQMANDLPFTVFKNGASGIYANISNYSKSTNRSSISQKIPSINIKLESIHNLHFGADFELKKRLDNVDCDEDYNYGIEYSGIDHSGKRIMGLCLVNSLEPVSSIDQFLVWQIPNDWKMEDAATVPFVYARACYIARLTDHWGFISSVLINMGNEIFLTEACIRLFLQKGCSVYVTVSNKSELIMIRKKCPQLEKFRILYKDGCQYERQVQHLTKMKGVDVVINCFFGIEHVTASLACVGKMSYYVETIEDNFRDVFRLGLFPFMRSVSFIPIPSKISFLLKIPADDKKILQRDLEEKIKRGIVTPFPKLTLTRGISASNDLKTQNLKIVTKCPSEKEVPVDTKEKSRYDCNHSYIIFGENSENGWLELVKWLIRMGASKFIVVLENIPIDSEMSSENNKNCLPNTKGINISFKPANRINTVEEASKLITEANEIGAVEAIYFVCVKSVCKKIRHLDLALQRHDSNKYIRFVSLFSGGLTELESRRSKGLPAILIHREDSKDLTYLLPELDNILRHCNDKESPTLYRVEEISKLDSKPIFSSLREYLPHTLKTLEKIGECYDIEIPIFIEKVSLALPHAETRGVYPIFIIPSLHAEPLDPLIKRLIYPVYCATLPATTFPISDMALALYQNVNKIQPSGPVTIIGETWNASLSIELSSLIKSSGRKYRLILLEGNPIEWKERLISLGDVNSGQFQNNLLKNVFNFSQTVDNSGLRSISSTSFQDQVKNYLSTFVSNGANREFVIRAANIIRNRLLSVLEHELQDSALYHTTLLTQHFSKHSSLRLSVTSNVVIIEETRYEYFLRNAKVISTINELAAFSWWNCPTRT